ncbi:hypothetical protein C479_13698 [Halovivax asiaticus JCM 14624]|uniref:DUF2262 domain-containing protein n=1 Tax=Halovivax asiaticus JCM 14624 TaxID=1227490 RepID=M0BD41_9EURY|nr:DUF2262 domain-containing protein [Halovivax asiaticus]ELZ08397.1 hypothetical protein C479_13698 [Halovivax asiaticus JCM 14624]
MDKPTVQWWTRLGSERERFGTDAALAGDDGLYAVGWYDVGDRTGDGFGGFLQRLGPGGTVDWEYPWGRNRRPKAVTVTPSGPVVAGKSLSTDTDQPEEDPPSWLASMTTAGVRRWEQEYPSGSGDSFETVVTAPDGVVAGGQTGSYSRRSPDSWERVYGSSNWLLAADVDDGSERWRERCAGTDCKSLVADEPGTLRYVSGSAVTWVSPNGATEHSEYYYAETGSSDTLDSIAPHEHGSATNGPMDSDQPRAGASVIAGKAWERSDANDARLLVIDADGEILLDRATGFAATSNFGRDAIALDDGYLLSGTALYGGGSLPWLAWFDTDGTLTDYRFVVRAPDSAPELVSATPDGPTGYPHRKSPRRHRSPRFDTERAVRRVQRTRPLAAPRTQTELGRFPHLGNDGLDGVDCWQAPVELYLTGPSRTVMVDESPESAQSQDLKTVEDERFGTFETTSTGNRYSTAAEWNSNEVELILPRSETSDGLSGLAVAKELWDDQSLWTKKIQEYAIDELLELKNVAWTESDEDTVTAEEFKHRMELKTVSIERDDGFTFWHYDNDLFFGHRIKVSGSLSAGITRAYL